jgi:hypothetical protein
MTLHNGSEQWRERTARCLLGRLGRRAARDEGVGIRQAWQSCERQQARDDLLAEHGSLGQDAEANRMITAVDAAADRRTDPDWD